MKVEELTVSLGFIHCWLSYGVVHSPRKKYKTCWSVYVLVTNSRICIFRLTWISWLLSAIGLLSNVSSSWNARGSKPASSTGGNGNGSLSSTLNLKVTKFGGGISALRSIPFSWLLMKSKKIGKFRNLYAYYSSQFYIHAYFSL